MEILSGIANPSLTVSPNETRQVRNQTPINPNNYKDAYKLDINPKYLGGELEHIAIADSEALFYTSSLDIIKKS